ncbi:MAG: hypothetical protein MJD61_07585 [Proteobacteria bacterium]|nr:hypothetical protein [Pseudomonadota bacterium]
MGYRVMDEYMRQGAAAASAFVNSRRASEGAASDTLAGQDRFQAAERMVQYATDMGSMWLDVMAAFAGSTAPRNRPGRDGESIFGGIDPWRQAVARPQSPTLDDQLRLALEIKSTRPAEVLLTLDRPLPTGELGVEPLLATDDSSRIKDVAVELPAEPRGITRVRVHVPSRCKAGRYTGAILELRSGTPRGRLTVVLSG